MIAPEFPGFDTLPDELRVTDGGIWSRIYMPMWARKIPGAWTARNGTVLVTPAHPNLSVKTSFVPDGCVCKAWGSTWDSSR